MTTDPARVNLVAQPPQQPGPAAGLPLGAAPGEPLRVDWTPAATPRTQRLAGFFSLREFDAAQAHVYPDTLDLLRHRELQAAVVHGVLSAAQITQLLAHVQAAAQRLPHSAFPAPFRSSFVGRNLNLEHPSLPGYFDAAACFNAALDAMPPLPGGLAQRLRLLLSAIDHGRPVMAAPGPEPGRPYMFTTLREHRPGGFIPPHFDNELRLRPSYRHLGAQIEPALLSFVLALTQAHAGGALEVFDSRCEPDQATLLSDDRHRHLLDTRGAASVRLRLPPGSLVVLDSGRHLHQLTAVQGSGARWTVCSFMARSRDGQALLCWG